MGDRILSNSIRLDDGTLWSVDADDGDRHTLEWLLRYGSTEQVMAKRFVIASVLASYRALLWTTQRQRNQVASEIKRTLASPQPRPEPEKKQ